MSKKSDGERIAALRQSRGDSQTKLATALGVSLWKVHRIERGKQEPSLRILRAIARHYRVRLSTLVGA